MTYILKFKNERDRYSIYRGFKAIGMRVKVDPDNLLLQVFEVAWSPDELKRLVLAQGVGGC